MRRSAGIGTVVFVMGGLLACSDSDGGASGAADTGDTFVVDASEPDAGETADAGFPDMGFPDTGPRDCSDNPFGCAPMQLLDIECRCLEACEGDLVWNPSENRCEEPFAGECGQDADCPGPDDVCLNVPPGVIEPCGGEETCMCFTSCDPFVPLTAAGCPAAMNGQPSACTHLLDPGVEVEALCLDPGMGAEQGEECNTIVSCDRLDNFLCLPLVGSPNQGQCQRICDLNDVAYCDQFGDGLECVEFATTAPDLAADFPDLGLCGPARVPTTDFGQPCGQDDQCADICSVNLGSACSQSCRGGRRCPENASCISFTGELPPDQLSICAVDCSSPDAVGDTECEARNAGWVCRDLFRDTADDSPVCLPPCTQNGCVGALTCDPTSGRCT